MNENGSHPVQQPVLTGPIDLSSSTIRSQLLWASLFPLAFFVLLTTLVTFSTLNQLMLNLVIQRNTAQIQVVAGSLAQNFASGQPPTTAELNLQLQSLEPVSGSQLYVVDSQGKPVASSEAGLTSLPLNIYELQRIISDQEPVSQLAESTAIRDKVVVSFALIPGKKRGDHHRTMGCQYIPSKLLSAYSGGFTGAWYCPFTRHVVTKHRQSCPPNCSARRECRQSRAR